MLPEFDAYISKYNQFLTLIADLHNAHVIYKRIPSKKHGVDLRRVIREIRIVQKELWDSSQLAEKAVSKARGPGKPRKDRNKNG